MPNRKLTPSPLPRLSSTSYVYPVRSLLEGRIQPAAGSPTQGLPVASQSSDDIVGLLKSRENCVPELPMPTRAVEDASVHTRRRRRAASIPRHLPSSSTIKETTKSNVASSSKLALNRTPSAKRQLSSRKKSPGSNVPFASDNPYFYSAFSSLSPPSSAPPCSIPVLETVQVSMSADEVLGNPNSPICKSIPYSMYASPLPLPINQTPEASPRPSFTALPPSDNSSLERNSVAVNGMAPPTDYNSGPSLLGTPEILPSTLTPHLDSCVLATPTATYPGGTPYSQGVRRDESVPRLPFNPSEYGIVHLPLLLATSRSNSERGSVVSSRHRDGTSGSRKSGSKSGSRQILQDIKKARSTPGSGSSSISNQAFISVSPQPRRSSIGNSQGSSMQAFSSDAGSDLVSDEPYTNFKFRSIEDENGNHIVIGREGKLQRCEDEPIRTPGAVQGFGVLIVVHEVEDTLVVHQVSENSTQLLGMPPSFLFGLECFTDTLPDSQAGVLWDNIEYLSEPDQILEEEFCPDIFLLTGYGAPGSALPDEPNSVDGKKLWTCWCAIHHSQSTNNDAATPRAIVMEFELEKDNLNPLYPPIVPSEATIPSPISRQDSSGGRTEVPSVSGQPKSNSPAGTVYSEGSGLSATSKNSSGAKSTQSLPLPGIQQARTPLFELHGNDEWQPSAEDILRSTTSHSRPLPALERLRRMTRPNQSKVDESSSTSRRSKRQASRGNSSVGMMDVLAVMTQINEQLGTCADLDSYLKVLVGVTKDLTLFHRVMVYQFDEIWNGQVVAELVDWSQSHDLFMGLHFPAGDIPSQARRLYQLNKVRLLYDTGQPTARIVVRSKEDLENPLNMTHCYLRAMSPIHIHYLENMGVRASMSISIIAFGQLWGLINCHTYGTQGMRVSFPVRQMLRLLSQTISKNIERLSFAQRLHTRKLLSHITSDHHPTGYIVSNADDLLGLFDADFGILVIGEGAKILGPNQHGQEILIMAEYLRLKQYDTIQASQAVARDFPDLELTLGFEVIAGLLYVPLSTGGKDFIAFLRRGQQHEVRWAGRPHNPGEHKLEPRTSFKVWAETVAGRSRIWTNEQLETAAVLALVYGKFIEVWREKENLLQTKKLKNLLLSNATHEVRTPLNHIINYLEMAMNGPLDHETRDNLSKSHAASKGLLFTINDLLDLTRLEIGNETSFDEPFDLHVAIKDATHLYRKEAERRNIAFNLDLIDSPTVVVGDCNKIRTVVQNLTANALKYTSKGSITVSCTTFGEPEGLRSIDQIAVEIRVVDTGCGIPPEKLESIFREFEQVQSSEPKQHNEGVGLGLAVVARIVEQLGGQLRVDSIVDEGSRFSFLIPLALSVGGSTSSQGRLSRSSTSSTSIRIVDNLVDAIPATHVSSSILGILRMDSGDSGKQSQGRPMLSQNYSPAVSISEVDDSQVPIQIQNSIFLPDNTKSLPDLEYPGNQHEKTSHVRSPSPPFTFAEHQPTGRLRVLIVEDNHLNRTILVKRLTMDGHLVVSATNGQEGLDKVTVDYSFDVVLMDIQMPILNGFEATRKIREFEKGLNAEKVTRLSHVLNGRIPVFAVSASLLEQQREELAGHGIDGWILKPINFKRLAAILKGVTDRAQRQNDLYRPGCNWEWGGWLTDTIAENQIGMEKSTQTI